MNEIQLFRSILQETEEGILVANQEGVILYANSFFKKSFSKSSEVRQKQVSEVLFSTTLIQAIKGTLNSKTPQTDEIALQDVRGRYLKLRSTPFQKGQIFFFRDVTKERKLERMKRDFVSNVSHEMRTPLSNIKGYTETLIDGALEDRESLSSFLSIISKHAERISLLIDDLLVLSRVEAQELPLIFSHFDIQETILSSISSLEHKAKKKEISIGFQCIEEDLHIEADREGIEQVLNNLIDNAIKYTPEGGKVSLHACSTSDGIQVDVQDTGLGISKKDQSRIFERFYRVDKARSREMGGTGLGLSIVKHIILSHKGKIRVKSKEEEGTLFSFSIPKS